MACQGTSLPGWNSQPSWPQLLPVRIQPKSTSSSQGLTWSPLDHVISLDVMQLRRSSGLLVWPQVLPTRFLSTFLLKLLDFQFSVSETDHRLLSRRHLEIFGGFSFPEGSEAPRGGGGGGGGAPGTPCNRFEQQLESSQKKSKLCSYFAPMERSMTGNVQHHMGGRAGQAFNLQTRVCSSLPGVMFARFLKEIEQILATIQFFIICIKCLFLPLELSRMVTKCR